MKQNDANIRRKNTTSQSVQTCSRACSPHMSMVRCLLKSLILLKESWVVWSGGIYLKSYVKHGLKTGLVRL